MPCGRRIGICRSAWRPPGTIFSIIVDVALTKPTFVAELRKILMALASRTSTMRGHSFRIGAATSAALAGVEDSTIQLLGRW